jgi:glycosyltransferase involved in cell wall biosynthesis
VSQRCSSSHFVWLGRGSSHEIAQFEHDVRFSGLADKIRATGDVKNPFDYIAAADVFALTSREDSYPLACLEAAALEKPIVCFADAGGTPEFIEENCGFSVPYLDIMGMADRVISLLDSPDVRRTMGLSARDKVLERHDIGGAAPRIMEIIERTIAEGQLDPKNIYYAKR